MTKSKAIIILIVMLLAFAGVTYVDFAGVDASGKGSASDIKLGLDLAGGVSITYQVVGEEEPSSTDMADTISKLQQRVWNYSTEAVVYQEGTDRINIEIPGVSGVTRFCRNWGGPAPCILSNRQAPTAWITTPLSLSWGRTAAMNMYTA